MWRSIPRLCRISNYSVLLEQNKLRSCEESDTPFQPFRIVYKLVVRQRGLDRPNMEYHVTRALERDFAGFVDYGWISPTLKITKYTQILSTYQKQKLRAPNCIFQIFLQLQEFVRVIFHATYCRDERRLFSVLPRTCLYDQYHILYRRCASPYESGIGNAEYEKDEKMEEVDAKFRSC